jgi:hypothetical protein
MAIATATIVTNTTMPQDADANAMNGTSVTDGTTGTSKRLPLSLLGSLATSMARKASTPMRTAATAQKVVSRAAVATTTTTSAATTRTTTMHATVVATMSPAVDRARQSQATARQN